MRGSSDKAEKDRDPVEMSGSGGPVVEQRARELSEKEEKFWEVLMRGTSNVPLPKGTGVQQVSGKVEMTQGVQQTGQEEKVGVQQSGEEEKLGVQQVTGKEEKWTYERMEERRNINARLRDGGTAHKVRVRSPPGKDTRGAQSGSPHPSSLCAHLIGLNDCRLSDMVKEDKAIFTTSCGGGGEVRQNTKTCQHLMLQV